MDRKWCNSKKKSTKITNYYSNSEWTAISFQSIVIHSLHPPFNCIQWCFLLHFFAVFIFLLQFFAICFAAQQNSIRAFSLIESNSCIQIFAFPIYDFILKLVKLRGTAASFMEREKNFIVKCSVLISKNGIICFIQKYWLLGWLSI